MRSARSNTVTSWPARVSCCAAARPAGPEPTTATFLPVSLSGGSGTTQPSLKALSMISTSTCLMVTASWLMPSTHDASHGAGHSRPVNSGKLLVACRRSMASRQRSRWTRSFHSPRRSGTGRRCGVSRTVILRKPRGSATGGRHDRGVDVLARLFGGSDGGEHSLVVARHHLDEVLQLILPIGQNALAHRRIGGVDVRYEHVLQPFDVVVVEYLQFDHLGVEIVGQRTVRVVDEGHAAGHARGEVAASRTEDGDLATG